MKSSTVKLRFMVRAAIIAALYVTLCLVLAPLAYGSVQIRFSEALTLLPVLCPEAVVGVTLGCFIANMIGSTPLDMVVGTLATFLAALATRKLRNVRWKKLALPASLPPVLFNAVILGVQFTVLEFFPASFPLPVFFYNMLTVGIGQLVACSVLGVALVWFIEKNPALLKMLQGEKSLT